METVEQLVSFQHIQVQLLGGAPWGFTVKGGLEYGEPLVITKIEEDGKAAQCKKLRVGDELININGSVLYGSRQEALILIKGSYRALRMAVRRRVVPVIRPHSWHLAKLSETPSPAAPDAPPAMQLHPRPFSAPWHSEGVSSDLSMQWNHLSRHCSTDRSSSIGSMESLDPPSQGYYDNQSPIDPAIFSNKRDSAYSSFSASSNTSDYTISLLPDEASSMDNLLHSLGSCRYADGDCPDSNFHRELNSKALSPSRSLRDKVRPSSYGCEEEPGRVRGRGPPQPPARSDSFRATRGILKTRDKRSASAPVDIVSVSSCWVEGPLKVQTQDLAECSHKLSVNEDCQAGCALEQYCTLGSQPEPCGARSRPPPSQPTSPVPADLSCSKTPAEGVGESAASPDITAALRSCHLLRTASKKSSAGGHRHSAPEKLLLAHLHTEGLSGDPEESHINPVAQWSRSPFYLGQELEGTRGTGTVTHGMWSGSRCSSCTTLVTSEPVSFVSIPSQLSTQQTRDSSSNVPGAVTKGNSLPDPTWDAGTLQEEVEIVTGAVGNVLKEGGERGEDPRPLPKQGSSRQRRLSKSRRRSERFATNLRNEIQRKKAELLKSTGSTSLLYGEDMLKEEEGVEQHFQDSACAEICQPSAQLEDGCSSPTLLTSSQLSTTSSIDLLTPHVSHSTDLDSSGSQPSNLVRPSYGQVVEEPAPAGKARRWRWTPEYKLPPRLETERRTDREGSVAVVTLQGTNASTNSCPSTNSENCDIPPFADRRKFFEETSRSVSMTNLPVLMSQHQKPETQRRPQYTAKLDPPAHKTEPHQRRYSYQGATNQDISRYCHLVGRRKTVSSSYNQEQEKEDTGLEYFSSDRLHKPAEQNVTPCLPVDDGRRSISYYQQPCEHYNPQDPPAPSNALLESLDYTQKQSEHSQKIPIEVPLPGVRETTKPNRFSLTDREYLLCRQDPQQADGVRAGQGGDPLVAGRLSVFSVTEPEARHPHQGRALSEKDIRLDPWRLQTPAAPSQESAGKNPEESAGVVAIKRPLPPPRPPLPDWELYHRRKASPQKFSSPHGQLCSESLSSPDVTRHRSHSLPLREEPERGQDGFHVQSGSASPCKSFTRTPPEPRLSVSETASNADQEVRWVATQWMDSHMYADQRISATSATEGSSKSDEEKRQQDELHDKMSFRGPEPGSAPDHSVVGEEEGRAFETDVDQLQEGAVEGLAKDVLHCFALSGKMLETDIDQLPGAEDPTLALPRPHSTSPVDARLAEEANGCLMEELFQQIDAGETCKSTWRGGRRVLELSVDTLERRARQGASNTEGPGSNCSSYYNTSTAKAQLLNKMKQHSGLHEENDKLSYKKTLVDSLQRKLAVLREAQRGLQEDVQANAQLGQEVEALVLAFCKPAEVDKFHMFVGDLDKVVSLLLSLSGRLLRVESALEGLSPDISHHEWLPLLEKKQQLQAQLGEAQELKEHVDRREQAVRQALGRCLTPEQLADYAHYVKMKASLLVEQRQLEDKIRLGEEQLRGLKESLGLGVGEAVGQAFG